MGRWGRGWNLAKQSWQVVLNDRTLLAFPLVSGVAAIFTGAAFFAAGDGLLSSKSLHAVGIAVIVVGVYALTVIAVFCGVALSACAARSLQGEDTTLAEGLTAARARLGVILAWAGVQLIVGAISAALQAVLREAGGQILSAIVGSLANLVWSVATFFVIPVLALESLGPIEAIERSSSVIRQRWGEGVSGSFAIGGIVFLLGWLPGIVLIVLGASTGNAIGLVLAALGVLVLIFAALAQTTIMSVFRVALFRFATDGVAIGGFQQSELEAAFRPKGR